MREILVVKFPEHCSGCELCVLEAQRQLKKVGINDSLIRIFREGKVFCVDLDPQVHNLDILSIKEICPRAVFTVEEQNERELF